MSDWKSFLKNKSDPKSSHRLQIDFRDSMELKLWIEYQSNLLGVPHSSVIKALIKAAMNNESIKDSP